MSRKIFNNNSIRLLEDNICPGKLDASGSYVFDTLCVPYGYNLHFDKTRFEDQYFLNFFNSELGYDPPSLSIKFKNDTSNIVQDSSNWYYVNRLRSGFTDTYMSYNDYKKNNLNDEAGFLAIDSHGINEGDSNNPAIFNIMYTDNITNPVPIYYRIKMINRNITETYASKSPFSDWPSNYLPSNYRDTLYNNYNRLLISKNSNKKFNKSDPHYDKYKKSK